MRLAFPILAALGLAGPACAAAPEASSSAPVAARDGRPDWLDRLPSRPGHLLGIGSGPDPLAAQQAALAHLAAQLETKVSVRTLDRQTASVTTRRADDVEAGTESRESQTISSTARFVVERSVKRAKVEDGYRGADGVYHALVSLDLEALARDRAAIEAAARTTIEAALASWDGREGARTGGDLEHLVTALLEVRDLERSELGREVAPRWQRPVAELRRRAQAAYRAIEVRILRQDPNGLVLAAELEGRPVAGLELGLEVAGGWADPPGSVVTDPEGRAAVPLGAALGGPRMILRIDLQPSSRRDRRSAGLTSKRRTVRFASRGPLEVEVVVEGARPELVPRLRAALAARVEGMYGARVVPRSQRALVLDLEARPTVQVGSRYSKTYRARIDWRGMPGRAREVDGSSLADGPAEAEARALEELLRNLRTDG